MQHEYLKHMGIEQWVLRSNQTPSQPCYGFQLMKEGQLVGLLLAETATENQAVFAMLTKITAALKLEATGEWYPGVPDVSAVLPNCRFVILMGEFVESYDDIPQIKTQSPERLLAEPALKREAWDDLQKVLSFF